MRVEIDDYCFACGPANPHGLKLKGFTLCGDSYTFAWTPPDFVQGWHKVVHGGIIATVLDEAMTRLLWEKGITAVTAELTIRFLRPLPVGTPTRVTARIADHRRKLWTLEAEIADEAGAYARATARYMQIEQANEAPAS